MAAAPSPVAPQALDELAAFVESFDRHLAAENKAAQTRRIYRYALTSLHDYLVRQGMPTTIAGIRREHVEAFLADLITRRKPATAATVYRGLRVFFAWLVDEEGELKTSPMQRMKQPHIPETPPPVLTDEQLSRLLKATAGRDFTTRRDAAILRLLLDTGMRRVECCTLRSG